MGGALSAFGLGGGLFQDGKLAKIPEGRIKILPGVKVDNGFTSPVLVITKYVHSGEQPQLVEGRWITVRRGDSADCCDGYKKRVIWCCLNAVCCNIPSCAQDCSKCMKKCCGPPPFQQRHFGMSEYTFTIPLTDVIQVTSTTRVVKRDDTVVLGSGPLTITSPACLECACFDKCDPAKGGAVLSTDVVVGDEKVHIEGHSEKLFAKEKMRSERHVVVRVRYLPNSTKGTGSNFTHPKEVHPEQRGKAVATSESGIDYVDISLYSSNEWNSPAWEEKVHEAHRIVEAVTALKGIMQTGRNPTPEEVTANYKAGLEIITVNHVPERHEEMKHTEDKKDAKPFTGGAFAKGLEITK